jgi:hypothetical protein
LAVAQSTQARKPNEPIQTIRRQYAAINKGVRRYRKVKKELSGFSLEGGELVAYFNGPAIVKIVATHYGEGGQTVEEYYYANGKLIFAFEKVSHYDRPMSGKVVRTAENRFYFSDGKLISWIDENGQQSSTATEDYRQKEKQLLENSDKLAIAARTKNRTVEALD